MPALFRKPFFPFLFALFPVLSLYAHNVTQLNPSVTIRSFVVVVFSTALLLLIFRRLVRDWYRSGLLTSITLLLFFTYGQTYLLVKNVTVWGLLIGRHRFLIPLWLAIFLYSMWILRYRIQRVKHLTPALNFISLSMLVLPLTTILQFEIQFHAKQQEIETSNPQSCGQLSPSSGDLPDVYYIILDAYAGHDVLWEAYQYDNSPFLTALMERGFFVADRSQSNYNHTELSLSSSLNMNYIQALDPDLSYGGHVDRSKIFPLLTRNVVREIFKCLEYKIVTFDSGYYWTGWRDADIFIAGDTYRIAGARRLQGINSFESMLIQTSAGVIVTSVAARLPDNIRKGFDSPYQSHRDRISSTLDSLANNVPYLAGSKFVFAHLLIPHPPYVFGPSGEPIEQYIAFTLGIKQGSGSEVSEHEGYPNQVTYINDQILQVVDSILAASRVPPIIILQGDHGIGRHSRDKLSILNAYYLPDSSLPTLQTTISPVNTFRVILNEYYIGQYEILEDVSYYSLPSEMLDFEVIPNERISLADYRMDNP